jgi:hypothetical protein
MFRLDAAHDPGQKGYDGHTLGLLPRPVEHPFEGFLERVAPVYFGRQAAGVDAGNHLESQEAGLGHQFDRQRPGSRAEIFRTPSACRRQRRIRAIEAFDSEAPRCLNPK